MKVLESHNKSIVAPTILEPRDYPVFKYSGKDIQ